MKSNKNISQAIIVVLFTISIIHIVNPQSCSRYVFPSQSDTDILLVGVIGLHMQSGGKCLNQVSINGFQTAVALKWGEWLVNGRGTTNSDEFLIPGVKIGIEVRDDCMTDKLASYLTNELIVPSDVTLDCGKVLENNSSSCESQLPVAGIIGSSTNETTRIVASTAYMSHIPVIGISATDPELSDKTKFPGFFRAVPSDLEQAKVIISLAKDLGWSYIVGIHTDDHYGQQGISQVQKLAKEERICFSSINPIQVTTELEELVKQIFSTADKTKDTSLGIVYYGNSKQFNSLVKFLYDKRSSWQQYTGKLNWIVAQGVDTSKETFRLMQGYTNKMIFLKPADIKHLDFKDYLFESLKDPPDWIKMGWKDLFIDAVKAFPGCESYNLTKETLGGCLIEKHIVFTEDLTPTFDALYLFANTLKQVHTDVCEGRKGLCEQMKEVIKRGILEKHKIEELNYTQLKDFAPKALSSRTLSRNSGDFKPDGSPLYSLWANGNQEFIKIGSYVDSKPIDMFNTEIIKSIPESQCGTECTECFNIDSLSYRYKHGDVIILGFFSIHNEASSSDFQCDQYRKDSHSYVALQAFISSTMELRNRTSIDFGYLVIDDCYSPLVATSILSKVMCEAELVFDPDTGQRLKPRSIKAAVGAQSTPVTLAVLPILQKLEIPLVSYSSTNPEMDNRITYPLFARTVSSDSVQGEAIMEILKELNVTHVGAIVRKNLYGRELYAQFRAKAEAEHICVEDALEIDSNTADVEIKKTLQGYSTAGTQVVVAILMDSLAIKVLGQVSDTDAFVFVTSEAWGPNKKILTENEGKNGKRARGALVLGASTSVDLDYGFKKYLSKISPYSNDATPWMRKFWQDQFTCNLPNSFNIKSVGSCQNKNVGKEALETLSKAPLVVHTIMATMSVGLAIDELKGAKYNSRSEYSEMLYNKTCRMELTLVNGDKFRPFLDSGNGNGGFTIYNIQLTNNDYEYVPVGSYRPIKNEGLKLNIREIKFYDNTVQVVKHVSSSCRLKSNCKNVCLAPTQTSTSTPEPIVTQTSVEPEEDTLGTPVIALIIIVVFLVAILLAIILVLCYFCRKRIIWTKDYFNETGARAVHDNYYESSVSGQTNNSRPPPVPAPRISLSGLENPSFSDTEREIQARERSLSLPQESNQIFLESALKNRRSASVSVESLRSIREQEFNAMVHPRPQIESSSSEDDSRQIRMDRTGANDANSYGKPRPHQRKFQKQSVSSNGKSSSSASIEAKSSSSSSGVLNPIAAFTNLENTSLKPTVSVGPMLLDPGMNNQRNSAPPNISVPVYENHFPEQSVINPSSRSKRLPFANMEGTEVLNDLIEPIYNQPGSPSFIIVQTPDGTLYNMCVNQVNFNSLTPIHQNQAQLHKNLISSNQGNPNQQMLQTSSFPMTPLAANQRIPQSNNHNASRNSPSSETPIDGFEDHQNIDLGDYYLAPKDPPYATVQKTLNPKLSDPVFLERPETLQSQRLQANVTATPYNHLNAFIKTDPNTSHQVSNNNVSNTFPQNNSPISHIPINSAPMQSISFEQLQQILTMNPKLASEILNANQNLMNTQLQNYNIPHPIQDNSGLRQISKSDKKSDVRDSSDVFQGEDHNGMNVPQLRNPLGTNSSGIKAHKPRHSDIIEEDEETDSLKINAESCV